MGGLGNGGGCFLSLGDRGDGREGIFFLLEAFRGVFGFRVGLEGKLWGGLLFFFRGGLGRKWG